jgi:hypothetical protein
MGEGEKQIEVELDVKWMGRGKQEAQSRKGEENCTSLGGQNIQQGTYSRVVFGMYLPLQRGEGG